MAVMMATPHGLPLVRRPRIHPRVANATTPKTTFTNPRTANLRGPTTTNPSGFWYISEQQWDRLRAEVEIPEKAQPALLTLSNFDAAGRVMETAEGIVVSNSCNGCSRPESTHACMVYAELNGKDTDRCAYCKRMNISPCSAAHPARHQAVMHIQETNHQQDSSEPISPPSSTDRRLASMESVAAKLDARLKAFGSNPPQPPTKSEARRLDRLEARDRSLKTYCKALEGMVRVLQDEVQALKLNGTHGAAHSQYLNGREPEESLFVEDRGCHSHTCGRIDSER